MQEPAPTSAVKRRRPAKSCNPCRLRKLKCDLAQPCGTCKRARASINCTYKSDDRAEDAGDATPAKKARPSEGSRGLPEQGAVPKGRDGGPSNHSAAPTPGRAAIEERDSEPDTNFQPFPKNGALRLRNKRDKTRLFGPSHWMHMAEALPLIPSSWDTKEADLSFTEHNINGNITDVVDMFLEIRKTRYTIKSRYIQGEVIHHESLTECLPGSIIRNELISHYVDFIQPIYRVLHMPSFFVEYQRLVNEPEAASTAFIMKLALVLAIGSTFYSHSDKFQIRSQAHAWILSAQSWIMGPGSKSTHSISGLQIYILLLLSKQMTCNSGGLNWVSSGSLLTMAMSMGLHQDPARFASLTPFQREMRKRLWAATLELYVQHHVDSSIPVMLNESEIVLPDILNVDDDAIGPDSGQAPTPEESFTDASIQIHMAGSLALRLQIGRLVNGINQNNPFTHILDLGRRLKDSCRSLSDFFSPNSEIMPGAFQAKASHFHQRFFNTLLRRYIILLHQPYMIASLENPNFYLARKICVDAAVAIVNELDPTKYAGELIQLAAAGRGTFKGPFALNVILVLSLELFMLFQDDNGGSTIASRVDPMDMMRGEARDSIRKLLRKIANGSKELMKAGSVSSKSFNFVTAVLAEADAMEHGRCTKTAVFNSLRISLKETLDIFRELHPSQATICESSETMTELDTTLFNSESFDLMNWDISDLLYMPELDN